MKYFFIIFLYSITILADINYDTKHLFRNTKCLVCQNQSIEDSNSLFAQDLKEIIKTRLEKGESITEIEVFLVKTYGPEIIYTPPFNFKTLFLWCIPFIIILFSFIILCKRIFKT